MLDHSHTKAILIGNSEYPLWEEGKIANVKVNLKSLKELLCNSKLIGIKDHPDTILELLDKTRTEMLVEIADFMGKCGPKDNLFVYYAGHGLLDLDNIKMLYLAAADTRINNKKITCISSDELKDNLIKCKAGNKIMILDCCYAGRIAGLQSDIDSLRGSIWGDTEGVYFIMSSDRDKPSRFDPEDETIPTFFTQRLIQTIEEGDVGNKDIWTLDDLYEVMKRKWDINIAPMPSRLTYKEIGNLRFCYNSYILEISKNIKITESPAEKRWKEIEADPKEEEIQQFIESCADKELRKKATNFLVKWVVDWKLFGEIISKNDPIAIGNFLNEGNPCKPIEIMARQKLIDILQNSRNYTRALMETTREERGPTKESQVWDKSNTNPAL